MQDVAVAVAAGSLERLASDPETRASVAAAATGVRDSFYGGMVGAKDWVFHETAEEELELGDHMCHHGVVVRTIRRGGGGSPGAAGREAHDDPHNRTLIVHFSGYVSPYRILISTLADFKYPETVSPTTVRVARYGRGFFETTLKRAGTCHSENADPGYVTALRALSLLEIPVGEELIVPSPKINYDPLLRNCELLSLWCKLGPRLGTDFRSETGFSVQSSPARLVQLAALGAAGYGAAVVASGVAGMLGVGAAGGAAGAGAAGAVGGGAAAGAGAATTAAASGAAATTAAAGAAGASASTAAGVGAAAGSTTAFVVESVGGVLVTRAVVRAGTTGVVEGVKGSVQVVKRVVVGNDEVGGERGATQIAPEDGDAMMGAVRGSASWSPDDMDDINNVPFALQTLQNNGGTSTVVRSPYAERRRRRTEQANPNEAGGFSPIASDGPLAPANKNDDSPQKKRLRKSPEEVYAVPRGPTHQQHQQEHRAVLSPSAIHLTPMPEPDMPPGTGLADPAAASFVWPWSPAVGSSTSIPDEESRTGNHPTTNTSPGAAAPSEVDNARDFLPAATCDYFFSEYFGPYTTDRTCFDDDGVPRFPEAEAPNERLHGRSFLKLGPQEPNAGVRPSKGGVRELRGMALFPPGGAGPPPPPGAGASSSASTENRNAGSATGASPGAVQQRQETRATSSRTGSTTQQLLTTTYRRKRFYLSLVVNALDQAGILVPPDLIEAWCDREGADPVVFTEMLVAALDDHDGNLYTEMGAEDYSSYAINKVMALCLVEMVGVNRSRGGAAPAGQQQRASQLLVSSMAGAEQQGGPLTAARGARTASRPAGRGAENHMEMEMAGGATTTGDRARRVPADGGPPPQQRSSQLVGAPGRPEQQTISSGSGGGGVTPGEGSRSTVVGASEETPGEAKAPGAKPSRWPRFRKPRS